MMTYILVTLGSPLHGENRVVLQCFNQAVGLKPIEITREVLNSKSLSSAHTTSKAHALAKKHGAKLIQVILP